MDLEFGKLDLQRHGPASRSPQSMAMLPDLVDQRLEFPDTVGLELCEVRGERVLGAHRFPDPVGADGRSSMPREIQ